MGIFFAAPIDQFPDYNRVTTVPTNAEAATGFPASNLLTMDPTQVCVNNDNSMTIDWDFGTVRTFDVVSLIHTNFMVTTNWTISVSNDNVTFTSILGSTPALAHIVAGQTEQNRRNMLRKNLSLAHYGSLQSGRYLRITVSDADVAFRPSVGRLFVGTKFKPSTGWQYGSGFDFQDLSVRERTDRGPLLTDPQPPIQIGNVKMEFLTKQEMYDFIWEFNYWRGSSREMLACLDTDDIKYLQKNTMYCVIAEGRRISFDSYNTHSVNWILENIAA